MDRTTRRRTFTLVAGIALAGLAAGTSAAWAQEEQAGTAPAAAQDGHQHGTSSAATGAAAPAAGEIPPPRALADVCEQSDLPPHTGFQAGPACVSLPFGELGAAEDNPQLLITDAPDEVAVGEAFTLRVSTRNLVRDRFLPAAEGGYYVEPSSLNEDGIVRGHFHTACRVLDGSGLAPRPERQAVFVATEDGAGGATPDTVTVQIPGLSSAGEAQCATWAGDGSHRMPMMAFANQVPAFDAVRITVRGGGAAAAEADADADADEQAPAVEAEEPAEAEQPTEDERSTAAEEQAAEERTDVTPTPEVEAEIPAAETEDGTARSRDDQDTDTDD